MKYGRFLESIDSKYKEQQQFLNDVACRIGVACYRPDYHADKRDCNTVLFYTLEDYKWNHMVDQQEGIKYSTAEAADIYKRSKIKIEPKYIYRPYFWVFQNTDVNGNFDYQFANRGRIDLRGLDWKKQLEDHIRLALAEKNGETTSLVTTVKVRSHCDRRPD